MPNNDPQRSVHGIYSRMKTYYPYHEQLKHPKWQKRAAEVKAAANWTCEDCGSRDKQLTAHHTAYVTRRMAWEYDAALLMCLCMDCHEWRQTREDAFRVALGELTRFLKPSELESEVWGILGDLRLKQTQRMAEAFS